MSDTATDQTSAGTAGSDDAEAKDYTHLFRSESLVSAVDLRVDVAHKYSRLIAGDEDVDLDVDELTAAAPVTLSRGARTRQVGEYKRTTGHEDVVTVGRRIDETVHGGVHQKVRLAAEAWWAAPMPIPSRGPACAWPAGRTSSPGVAGRRLT